MTHWGWAPFRLIVYIIQGIRCVDSYWKNCWNVSVIVFQRKQRHWILLMTEVNSWSFCEHGPTLANPLYLVSGEDSLLAVFCGDPCEGTVQQNATIATDSFEGKRLTQDLPPSQKERNHIVTTLESMTHQNGDEILAPVSTLPAWLIGLKSCIWHQFTIKLGPGTIHVPLAILNPQTSWRYLGALPGLLAWIIDCASWSAGRASYEHRATTQKRAVGANQSFPKVWETNKI